MELILITTSTFKLKDIWFEATAKNNVLTKLNILPNHDLKTEKITSDIAPIIKYLEDYLSGNIYNYQGKIEISGTEKEKAVLTECMKIPAGEILSYKELAEKAGIKNGARFAGNVMAKNKLLILIPCHRVVPTEYYANGRIGNYGPGEIYKKRFLKIEGRDEK